MRAARQFKLGINASNKPLFHQSHKGRDLRPLSSAGGADTVAALPGNHLGARRHPAT
jgi:hypothetical protein